MKLTKISLFLSLLIALVSCGNGTGEVTKTNFVFSSAIANIGGQTGGIMVFGNNRQSGQSISFVLSNEPIELSNGTWDFLYTSWDGIHSFYGANSQLEGVLRCGQSMGVELNGAETPVSMVLSTAGCASPLFGASSTKDGGGNPLPLDFYGCSNGGIFEEGGDAEAANCKFSPADSFQVFIPERLPSGEVRQGLVSRCIENTNVFPTASMNNTNTHEIKIPMFLPVIGNPVIGIRIFEGNNCENLLSETRVSHLYAGEFQGDQFELEDDDGAAINNLLVKVNVCDAAVGNTTTPFEYEANKYVICDKDQFPFIKTNNTFQYFLDRDIDFGGDVFAGHVIDTFTPSGLIDGQNHRISNLTINSATNATGFISTSSGTIRNLKFSDITVNCSAELNGAGALIGNVSIGGEVSNIEVSNITIDATGCDHVGGLLGQVNPGVSDFRLDNVTAENISVTIDQNSENIGGLIGYAAQSSAVTNQMSNLILNDIRIDNIGAQTATKENIGGVIGSMRENLTSVANVLATNIVMGGTQDLEHKRNIGLFAGSVGFTAINGANISSTKVVGTINATSNTEYIGGIAGHAFSSNLKNIVADVDINAPTSNFVGGAVGAAEGDGMITDIEQARTFGTIDCVSDCGGVVGIALDGTNRLELSSAYSDVTIDSAGLAVGGIIGRSQKGLYNQLQYDGTITGAASSVGGIAGNISDVEISDFSDLVFHGSVAGSNEVGGIAGEADFSNFASSLAFSISDGVVAGTGGGIDYAVGLLVTGTGTVTDCYAVDTDGGGAVGVTNCTGASTADLTDLFTLDAGGFGVNASFFDGGGAAESELQFVHELSILAGLSSLGSFQEPLSISTREGWNTIGDSEFLMNKAFRLDADISFNSVNGDFNPIGSSTSPFKGVFFGNNHILRDIDLRENSGTEPLGIFRKLESDAIGAVMIADINKDETELRKLFIENVYFEYSGGALQEGIGALAGRVSDFANQPVTIAGVVVRNATLITDSTDTTSGAGGMIGSFSIDSPDTRVEQVTLENININTASAGTIAGTGGVFGSVTQGGGIASEFEFQGYQVRDVTIDGGAAAGFIGGIAGNLANEFLKLSDVILEAIDLTGTQRIGGVFGFGEFKRMGGIAVSGLTLLASGDHVGGLVGFKDRGDGEISGSYVLASSITADDFAACAVGAVFAGEVAELDNSYFICPVLSATTTSLLSTTPARLTFAASNSVFYVGGDESITGSVPLANDSFLRDPEFLVTNYPNFLNLDPWVFKPGELPRTVAEEFPQFFFY
jgi:hypothetical protein